MADEIEIELQDTGAAAEDEIRLPMNFLTIGEIGHDDVKVYVKQSVYKALEKYSLADVEHERGTILIGEYSEALGKTHVIVSDYIEAKYTDASASTLTFTHETWEYVHKEHDEKFADKRIIGWQHTHPGYGIFLSNYDMFIQENFFNLPFQLAYVIDPVQNLRGFFQWKGGKVEKLNGFYIYDEVGSQIKLDAPKKEKKTAENTASGKSWKIIAVLAALTAMVCLVSVFTMQRTLKEQLSRQEALEAAVASQAAPNAGAQDSTAVSSANELPAAGEELSGAIDAMQATIDAQQQMIEELQQEVSVLNGTAYTVENGYLHYTVKPGDSLYRICKSLGISFYAHRAEILSLNGIASENLIYVGQALVFPESIRES